MATLSEIVVVFLPSGVDRSWKGDLGSLTVSIPEEASVGEIGLLAAGRIEELKPETWPAYERRSLAEHGAHRWCPSFFDARTHEHHVWLGDMNVVGDEGEVIFNQPTRDVTLFELRKIAEADILPFPLDCSMLGLWCVEGLGGGYDQVILDAWWTFQGFLIVVAHKALTDLLVDEAKRLLGALTAGHLTDFRRRNARPRDITEFIWAKAEWSVPELALRLRITDAEARVWLSVVGYRESTWSREVWVYDCDPAAPSVANMLSITLGHSSWEKLSPQARREFAQFAELQVYNPDSH